MRTVLFAVLLAPMLGIGAWPADAARPRGGVRPSDTPNILLIVMDDVGVDQMKLFGYGGDTPPSTPSLDKLAQGGVRFHNYWSMPACSTSRAVLFEGRYPFRTNVYAALGPSDLANSMVSPYEMTAPKLLAKRGYQSGLFGKFHLGLQGNNPAELRMPRVLGWDYYAGWLDETGDPSSIDTTAGGVADAGTWKCGFVGSEAEGGADTGACYQPDGACENLSIVGSVPPGRLCMSRGGLLVPDGTCPATPGPPPEQLNFQQYNGHYVSPFTINHPNGEVEDMPPTDARARRFRATVAVDEAIAWINGRPEGQPWMASVAFASAHTPVMQTPVDERSAPTDVTSGLDCADTVQGRELTNDMIENIDEEIARLLVETGIARRTRKGKLVYRPKRSDTMIIVSGDNGSLGASVKLPFESSRAKGTAYQTGVWIPLVVSGPLVRRPNRVVSSMVNIADVYQLFGEIAGLDVHATVPRPIDSHAMLPYLQNPKQASIRRSNFTQVGPNLQANGANNGPCVISTTCTQIPVTKSVCEDNNGVWWGVGADNPSTAGSAGLEKCCNVLAYMAAEGQTDLPSIAPLWALGMRNDRYKIVENTTWAYTGSQDVPCAEETVTEFYEIDEAVPNPMLDRDADKLPLDALTEEQQANYDALSAELSALLASNEPCPADGDLDGIVNNLDIGLWGYYAASWGRSSVSDVNLDGLTDDTDRALIAGDGGLCPVVAPPLN